MIRIEVPLGMNWYRNLKEVICMAKAQKTIIEFEFNGLTVQVHPTVPYDYDTYKNDDAHDYLNRKQMFVVIK